MTHSVYGNQELDLKSRFEELGGSKAFARAKKVVRVAPGAREGAPILELPEVQDSDVVEVELEGGLVLWTRVDTLREDAARGTPAEPRDAAASPAATLPTHYPLATTERGIPGIAIRVLRFFDVDIPKGGARLLAGKVESKIEGDGKVFRVEEDGSLVADAIEPGSQDVLLFLHGTGSSSTGAFGALTQSTRSDASAVGAKDPDLEFRQRAWRELRAHYGNRIFAFEHKSLTKGPVENAVELLRALPATRVPPLHLVSHSRGGLIGDLLAFGEVEGQAFDVGSLGKLGNEELEHWKQLNELLHQRQPRVQRFLRVASPAGGTTLASRRLDIYFSLLIKLLGGVPAVGPFLGPLAELAAAVAKERTDPKTLPGLAAMMPRSPLVRALAATEHTLSSDLTVISGDSDGFIKNLANLFYWHANDLVVQTRSMYLGAPRTRRFWYRAEGREVQHCSYFLRRETVAKLVTGLLRKDDVPAGFETVRPKGVARGTVPGAQPEDGTDRTAVILIPGIMGSHLRVHRGGDSNRIWLDLSDLAKGRMSWLAIGASDNGSPLTVTPDGVIASAYESFTHHLRDNGYHVIPFPYDWRLSVLEAANALEKLVTRRLKCSKESKTPVHLVAHSMGGLVARGLIAEHQECWKEVLERGGRLIQLGTPNRGSYLIPSILRGKESILKKLATVDLSHSVEQWAELVSCFPGLVELRPQDTDLDLSKRSEWKRFKPYATPSSALLREADQTIHTLQQVVLANQQTIYVAGRAEETPTLKQPTSAGDGLELTTSAEGDGRVLWATGIPPNVPTYYIDTPHGNLLDHKSAFEGLTELIATGSTRKLLQQPPMPKPRAAARGDFVPEDEVFPDQQMLEAAALGMEEVPELPTAAEGLPLTVRVVHGDLAYCNDPIMVGHYVGDPIVHAEAAIDRAFEGELTFRHQLGLYPGAIGTAEVVLGPCKKEGDDRVHAGPSGALILGLGHSGELTPGGLIRSVEAALLRLVQLRTERGESTTDLTIATLLIGSGEAGISMEQSVESILLGVRQVNQRLSKVKSTASTTDDGPGGSVREVKFIELFEDVALAALHALHGMTQSRFPNVTVAPTLERLPGRRKRPRFDVADQWWTRLQIESDEDDRRLLTFTAYGQRARIPVEEVSIPVEVVERLLHDARQSTRTPSDALPQTLFELLIPRALKSSARDRRNLSLVLDRGTARYPWELLLDRDSGSDQPLGLGAGLLRQLKSVSPPEVAHPEPYLALVVGDPPSELAPLPEAREEAKAVASALSSRGWQVVRQISGDPDSEKMPGDQNISASSVITQLMTSDYRILHLAGHGVYHERSKTSGMVLGAPDPSHSRKEATPTEGADGRPERRPLLTAGEIQQMRLTPELVFVNCCHLGRIEPTAREAENLPAFHRLAATLAEGLIRAGVKAVIAAGWAVDDEAAQIFARRFYDLMLTGGTFGDATRTAREETFRIRPDSNTWAAYQCYGSPGFRLRDADKRTAEAHRRALGPHEYVDGCELAIELDNIANRASAKAKKTTIDDLKHELEELEHYATTRGWLEEPSVAVGLARAHGELGDFHLAIEWYERAQGMEDSTLSLKDLEQKANWMARYAEKRHRRALAEIESTRATTAQSETKKAETQEAETQEAETQEKEGTETPQEGEAEEARKRANTEAQKLCEKAIAELKSLLALGETPERRSLLASAYKRRLMIALRGREPRREAASDLHQMIEEYARAAELAPGERAYPLLNALAGVLLSGGPVKKATSAKKGLHVEPAFLEAIEAARTELRSKKPRDFWDDVMPVDLDLLVAIAHGKLGENQEAIVEGYQQRSRIHGSPRELASVADQLAFFKACADKLPQEAYGRPGLDPSDRIKAATLSGQIEALQKALKRLADTG